jgi:hypothetical protein
VDNNDNYGQGRVADLATFPKDLLGLIDDGLDIRVRLAGMDNFMLVTLSMPGHEADALYEMVEVA